MAEKNYVVNVKTKLGTIFTVRADSAEELNANITDVINHSAHESVGALEELLTGIVATPVANPVETVLNAVGGVVISTESSGVTPTAFAPVAPPVQASPTVGDKTCVHGVMVKRTGTGAKGEWRAFFCPTPKGTADQCSAQFANRNTPEWNSF